MVAGLLSNVVGQDDMGKKQKIQALYIAYVTQQLTLTEVEAQKFWPIHGQYDAEIKAVGVDLPELERQQSLLNIKKKYSERFTTVLGKAERTDKFFKIDEGFRRKLIEEMRKRRQQNSPGLRQGNRRNR